MITDLYWNSPAAAFFIVLVSAVWTCAFAIPGHLSKSVAFRVALAKLAPFRCDAHDWLFRAWLCDDLWWRVRVRVAGVVSQLLAVS